jgi:hypothetical protein
LALSPCVASPEIIAGGGAYAVFKADQTDPKNYFNYLFKALNNNFNLHLGLAVTVDAY